MNIREEAPTLGNSIWLANVFGTISVIATLSLIFVTVLAGSMAALFESASVPARILRLLLSQ